MIIHPFDDRMKRVSPVLSVCRSVRFGETTPHLEGHLLDPWESADGEV